MSEQENVGGSRATSSVWWLVSAAVIVLVLVGLGFVLLSPGGNGQADPAPARSTPAPASSQTTAGPSGRCDVRVGDQTVPRKAPKTEWKLRDGVALPASAAGPAQSLSGVGRCYARSPEGVLLAAANYALGTQLPSRKELVEQRVTPGPEKDAALRAVATMAPAAETTGRGQVAGFRILSYTKDSGVVAVALQKQGAYVVVTYPMVWSADDWKVDGNPPGGMPAVQTPSDLSGFIPWAGV